jgi:membrane fusion protein (multidrug efflux system)
MADSVRRFEREAEWRDDARADSPVPERRRETPSLRPELRSSPPAQADDAPVSRGEVQVPDETKPMLPASAPTRKRTVRKILFALGAVVLIGGTAAGYLTGGRWASTDDSYVKADIANVTTDVSGLVADVAVRDNQTVRKGDLLFRLDDEPYRIALDGARAQMGVVANQLKSLQASYAQAQSQIALAQTDLDLAKKILARQTDLAAKSIASQATWDQASRDFSAAQSRLQAAQLQASMTSAQLGGAVTGPIDEIAQYKQAKAQVDKADRDLRHTKVYASDNGVVTNVPALQPGNYLNAAQTAFNLVASDHVWVEAFMKETDLTFVKPGDPASIAVDTYSGRQFKAIVDTIAPATGSQFSVLPAQNSSGNWVKVVQRIVVRLRVEQPADAPPLRAGMSVVSDIDTGHKRTLASLPHDLREMVGL